jgi:hypothetical protein
VCATWLCDGYMRSKQHHDTLLLVSCLYVLDQLYIFNHITFTTVKVHVLIIICYNTCSVQTATTLKFLRTEASRQLLIARITAAGFTPPSPKPHQSWEGYRVTIAHHEEVGVSADGHASASPSGVAAVAPPAGCPTRSVKTASY